MLLLVNGGTFDYEAGRIKRAPVAFQKLGIEWMWRLVREPKRIVCAVVGVPASIIPKKGADTRQLSLRITSKIQTFPSSERGVSR